MRRFLHTRIVSLAALLITVVIAFSSCTKYTFMPVEDKIVGKWRFEKVSFIKGYSLTKRDVTYDYTQWEYEFTADNRFFMYNNAERISYEGKYYLTADEVYDPNSDTYDHIYDVHVSVYNPTTNQIEQFIWEVTGLTGKRFRATEYFSYETWYYQMYRL